MKRVTLLRIVSPAWFAICLAIPTVAAAADRMQVTVAQAEIAYDQRTGQPLVSFRMSEASKLEFADLTARNIGKKAEYRLDGRLLMAPIIRQPITGGSGQIFNPDFDLAQNRQIVERLIVGKAMLDLEFVAP